MDLQRVVDIGGDVVGRRDGVLIATSTEQFGNHAIGGSDVGECDQRREPDAAADQQRARAIGLEREPSA